MVDLAGRVAIVTGANGGIGGEICRLFAEAGASVIGVDRVSRGGTAPVFRILDVTDEAAWHALAADVEREHGALDILVHNAGVATTERLQDTSHEQLRRTLAVNLEGPFLGTKACIDLMRRTGEHRPHGTSIVMISSIMGLVGGAFSTAYCASKGGVRLLAKAAAVEFLSLKYAVRVNSVHPGPVPTPMVDDIMDRYVEMGLYPDVAAAERAMSRPLGRMTSAADIARAVRFLASDDAAHITGTEMVVDGGFVAR
jgi:NAD(P)-dependent dehydrogenase (short-subunit alcohol dehydrogenase family)